MINELEQIKQRILKEYEASGLPVIYEETYCDEMMLPMSDGAALKTYIFRGCKDGAVPVILQRSPYAHALEIYKLHGRELAKRGFGVVLQFCRGTGESEGEWNPNVNERKDGIDTLQWLCALPWVKNVGYWGGSYLALTGWCMADCIPDKVRGMYLGVYGTDRFTSAYEKGLFRHDVLTAWAMENAGYEVRADYMESCKYRPHVEVDEALWGRRLPWYRDWVTATTADAPYWQEGFWKMLSEIPSRVKIPLFITDAWYDHHLGSAIKSYEKLSEEAREKSTLRLGCWNHSGQNCIGWEDPENLQNSEIVSMTKWFWDLLVEEREPQKKTEVYVIGADKWIEPGAWPMPVKEIRKLYLSGNYSEKVKNARELTFEQDECAGGAEYDYDPENPVPSLGAEAMLRSMDKVGSLFQPEAGFRDDVVSFVSRPLSEKLTIGGKLRVHLSVISDCEDTAFSAKIMEMRADGTSVNIRSSITTIAADCPERYHPGEIAEVCVDMWDIVWEVKAGSRIRIDISSSDFPQYAIHSNYPGIWSEQRQTKTAHQQICCEAVHPSWLEIPVLGKA